MLPEHPAFVCDNEALHVTIAAQSRRIAALEAQLADMRGALCGLMGIDGSPESVEIMKVGIVIMEARMAPDPEAPEAVMRCVEVLEKPFGDSSALLAYGERCVRAGEANITSGKREPIAAIARCALEQP